MPEIETEDEWTPEQIALFRVAFEQAVPPPHRPLLILPPQSPARSVVLDLHWTEDGEPKQEMFGPWTGREPDEATLTLVTAPAAWISDHGPLSSGN